MADYERTLAEKCVPVGQAVNANIACVTQMMCADSEEEALRRGLEGGNFFGYSLGHYYVFGEHEPGKTDVWAEFVERRAERGYSPEIEAALEPSGSAPSSPRATRTGLRGATGTPDQIREYLRRFEEAGVDQVIFVHAGRQEPPRGHLRVARAVRHAGAARVQGAGRGAGGGQGRAAGSR